MIKGMKRQKGMVSLIAGIGTVFIGYFAWGLLTLYHKSGAFGTAGFLFSVLTMALYTLFCHTVITLGRKDFIRQLMVISGWGALLSLLLLVRGGAALFGQNEYAKLALNILWLVDLAGCCLWIADFTGGCLWSGNKMRRMAADVRMKSVCVADAGEQSLRIAGCADRFRTAWRNHKWLYLLLAATAFLLIEPDVMQFKWDGLLYYRTCRELAVDSISSLAVYGHIAQTYGMCNGLGTLIAGDTAVAMIGINVILLLCSVCAFYGLIKCMLPGKQEFVYALVTAVYAWSPFTLGMVYYHNLDFYCQCFCVIMLYFLYQRQWIYFFAASMLFCFTKEPAILIYGAVCVGIVILDFAAQTGLPLGKRIGKLLRRKQYYFMVLPGILWLATYEMLGPWSAGGGGFQIDPAYMVEKLKVLYVFQFNWLFTLLCLCGTVFCIVRKEKSVWRCLFPVLCGQTAFTAFSCLFCTVNHPRYNGASQPMLTVMAILLTAGMLERMWGKVLAGGLAALLAVSAFCTIDPVTLWCFPGYRVGAAQMVTTGSTPLGDGMIYNRQMLWLEGALEMALEEAVTEGDTVFFPALEDSTYFFDGMAEVGSAAESGQWEEEYWNAREGRREAGAREAATPFMVCHLPKEPDWDEIAGKLEGGGNYYYLSCAGAELAEEIRERFHVLEESEYAYKGWRVCRICFK